MKTPSIRHNKNKPELFPEIIKSLGKLKNNDKIKKILDTTKVIKSQKQPKNLFQNTPLF